MAVGLRLRSRATAYAVLASSCGFAHGCGPADAAPPFLGQFTYELGTVQATCQGTRFTQELAGIQVDIVRDGAGLAFIAGPRCRIGLDVDDGAAQGTDQRCQISLSQTVASALFSSFALSEEERGIRSDAAGTAELIVPYSVQITCEQFTLSGILLRRDE